ncbi:MAG: hypothetical protein HY551_00280 [Elusimicrobia bacterium]|nr:hypothetical protein [Elusimicrobiota bacterium]
MNAAYSGAVRQFEEYLSGLEREGRTSPEEIRHIRESGVLNLMNSLRQTYKKGIPYSIGTDVGSEEYKAVLEKGLGSEALEAFVLEPFMDAVAYKKHMISLIENAERFLEASVYHFDMDDGGREMFQRLVSKKLGVRYDPFHVRWAREGVELQKLNPDQFKPYLLSELTGRSLDEMRHLGKREAGEIIARRQRPIQIFILVDAKNMVISNPSLVKPLRYYSTNRFHNAFDEYGIVFLEWGKLLKIARIPLPLTSKRLPLPVPSGSGFTDGVYHAKYMYNDKGQAIVMGQGIADKYFQSELEAGKKRPWRDGGWYLQGKPALPLSDFHLRQVRRSRPSLDTSGIAADISARLHAVAPLPGRPAVHFIVTDPKKRIFQFESLVFSAIASARSEILVDMGFFADSRIAKALMERKRANPELRVIVIGPGWTDQPGIAAVNRCLRMNFIRAGIRVFRWRPDPERTPYDKNAMLHLKAFMVDGRLAYLGSGNFLRRSRRADVEAGYVTQDPEAVGKLRQFLEEDLDNSQEAGNDPLDFLETPACAALQKARAVSVTWSFLSRITNAALPPY